MEIIVRNYQNSDLNSLNVLLDEVYNLKKVNSITDNIEIVAVKEEKIVGYLTLSRLHDSVRNIYYFYVNYVCVKREFRRCGIATKLFNYVFDLCSDKNISYIELTSNSSRTEANKLYERLGFNIRNTNVFRKDIK